MQEHMYGVVLWADASDTKAVIWCEDQGNLAYYTAAEEDIHEGPALDARFWSCACECILRRLL